MCVSESIRRVVGWAALGTALSYICLYSYNYSTTAPIPLSGSGGGQIKCTLFESIKENTVWRGFSVRKHVTCCGKQYTIVVRQSNGKLRIWVGNNQENDGGLLKEVDTPYWHKVVEQYAASLQLEKEKKRA